MNLPDKPLRILGLPWCVEVVDRIDGNPDVCFQSNIESNTFKLGEHCHPGRVGWHLFWGVLYALHQHVGYGEAESRPGEFDGAHCALYTAIADNWPTVRLWFGYDGEPVIEPCALRIAGMNWSFERPKWIPGRDANTLGYSQGEQLSLYVRADGVTPHRATEVALHELMHGSVQMISRLGDVEAWVAGMSGPLTQVFFDNAEWMDAIFGDEEEPEKSEEESK